MGSHVLALPQCFISTRNALAYPGWGACNQQSVHVVMHQSPSRSHRQSVSHVNQAVVAVVCLWLPIPPLFSFLFYSLFLFFCFLLLLFFRAQELYESRGGRPGFPSLISLRFLWSKCNTQPTRCLCLCVEQAGLRSCRFFKVFMSLIVALSNK